MGQRGGEGERGFRGLVSRAGAWVASKLLQLLSSKLVRLKKIQQGDNRTA